MAENNFTMTPVNVFWIEPKEFRGQNFMPMDPSERGLGFFPEIPYPQPVSSPFYYGENAIPDRRELNFSALPELFAIDDRLPENSVSPNNPIAKVEKKVLKV